MENTYNIEDFNSLIFNVYRIEPETDAFELFPKLKQFPEFVNYSGGNFNTLIRYIGFMYDFSSPLNKITDVSRRKIECAKLAGYRIGSNGKFHESVENMMKCKNSVVNKMIIRYCKLSKSDLFPFYVAQSEWLDKQYESLMSGETKVTDSSKINEIVLNIQKIRSDILGSDNNKALNDDLIDFIDDEVFALRPEDIAIKMKKGKDPLSEYSPYKE